MFIDYHELNILTIKIKYPVPRTEIFVDQLRGVKVFFEIDLQLGYHQFKLKSSDIPKSAF